MAATKAVAQDSSPAPFLQWFDSSYQTMHDRSADLFMAGYGAVWTPPPGRADSSDFSVGYDVYDRFDLGSWDHKTLYGTEAGIKSLADVLHRQGAALHIDAVINHNGFSDQGTPGFVEAGGYPGFLLQNPDGGSDPFGVPGTDGDFNSSYDYGDLRGRLAGLIDIDHGKNFRFIRNPVPGYEDAVAGDHGGNLRPGTTPDGAGRLANVALESNRRFYPDRDLDPIYVFDPVTGESGIAIYPFNPDDPMAGDPVGENATGYLMRYLQWMVQDVGVDGFRIDAAKHVEGFTFDYLDRAVYRSNPRTLLDGSQQQVFSYSEVFDGSREVLMSYVRKNIDPNDLGRVGGNRDALDFAYHFGLKGGLTDNGFSNDWGKIVGQDMDFYDDGLYNGSAGVKFIGSHDEPGPALSNVAHAHMLMMPGNAVVYFNGKEFGDNRDFPKDGRGDALGGVYGTTITTLLDARNTHGRGDYRERYLDKELYAFERSNSALVLLNNRLDGGYDERRIDVDFAWGQTLVELTGNAAADSNIAELITVDNDFFEGPSKATVRFRRNDGADQGYLIYGLATPQSADGVVLTQESGSPVMVLSGSTPDANGYANGTTRLTDWHVITDDHFDMTLQTQAVTLAGQRLEGGVMVDRQIRDRDADGDNALFRIDSGLDLNGINPHSTLSGVDFDAPGSVTYGFEQFVDVSQNGYADLSGNGLYVQQIDASQLSEGTHYVTVRAFRHRDDGGPAVYSDFKKVIYVDRLAPESGVWGFKAFGESPGDNDVLIQSLDGTANSVHVLTNLGAALSESDILGRVQAGEGATERVDLDLFKTGLFGIGNGNNVFTVVTFEPTGNRNIQRFTGITPSNVRGAGLGDLNFDGAINGDDIGGTAYGFEAVLYSRDQVFNPAADFDADGRVGWSDLVALRDVADATGNTAAQSEYLSVLRRRGNVNQAFGTDSFDIDATYSHFGDSDWYADIDSSGNVDQADVDALVHVVFGTHYGDANLDGRVDLQDFASIGQHFGDQPTGWHQGNFTGDASTDLNDFALLGQNFGKGVAAASLSKLNSMVVAPGGLNLIVDVLSGEVWLEGNLTAITGYQIESLSGALIASQFDEAALVGLGAFAAGQSDQLIAEATLGQAVEIDGLVRLGELFNTASGRDLVLTYTDADFNVVGGAATVYVPEPSTLLGLGVMLLVVSIRAGDFTGRTGS